MLQPGPLIPLLPIPTGLHRAHGDPAEHVLRQRGLQQPRREVEERGRPAQRAAGGGEGDPEGGGPHGGVARGHEAQGGLRELRSRGEGFGEGAAGAAEGRVDRWDVVVG